MATLNIKAFPDELYEALRDHAAAEHRSIAQQVIHLVSRALEDAKPTSILSLRGLGKDRWADVDASSHVDHERSSWD